MRLSTLFLFSILTITVFGQFAKNKAQRKKNEFILKIDSVNFLLDKYQTLSPFSDNGNEYRLIDSIGNEIISHLLTILNDKRILQFEIDTLFGSNDLFITKSEDHRIYFLSIDEKTGGSYRTSRTIIHYRLQNGNIKAESVSGDPSEAMVTAISGTIYLIDTTRQTYFLTGSVQTCNTCIAKVAITLQLDSDSYHTELIAQFDGRVYDLDEFDYNAELKEILITSYAADNDDSLYGGNNEVGNFRRRYTSKFKYTNGEFIEIEKCEFLERNK